MSYLAQRRTGQVISIALSTGGSGYTSPPAVTISGGGGTGAVAVAHMAGTQVESIAISNAGTGYTSSPTISVAGSVPATATAYVYSGTLLQASFVRSRFNDMYVFDGMGRGLRWDGVQGAMQPIGLQKPYKGPTLVASGSAAAGYVDGVDIVIGGLGYTKPPSVTFTGGTPTKAAVAMADIANGRVVGVTITEPGSGYQAAPVVAFTGGNASGGAFAVGVTGCVAGITVTDGGTGYTSSPTVVFSSEQGLTKANATVSIEDTVVTNINLLSGGTGSTAAVTVSLVGGGGSGAALKVGMSYRVAAVTVTTPGTGYVVAPFLTFTPDAADPSSSSAGATAAISGGTITGVTVYAGGVYSLAPTVSIANSTATGQVSLYSAMRGKYKCATRYIDATPERFRGPLASSISELIELETIEGASTITWTLAHAGLDDRVFAVELWRTTADQSVLLYRVGKILRSAGNFTGTFTDTLSDADLIDTERDGYGLLPVTLPSGQINSRRFGVPPGNYAVACMFQDRAWMAVDTTGEKLNSLYYSEVDEPESIPDSNELVVQENAGDSDAIVALIPLAGSLLIAQSRHLYKLQYVAQPVIDASILLASYRGVLNQRCWDVLGGVAFIVDSYGMYGYDGNQEQPISIPVDNYWREDSLIDFTQSSKFFVQADTGERVVRFFYCQPGDTEPVRSLCYSVTTKTWWKETYAQAVTAAAPLSSGGKQGIAYGLSTGSFVRSSGYSDLGTPITYQFRSGPLQLVTEQGKRGVTVTYTPTTTASYLSLSRYFNGSLSRRANAIQVDSGNGFISSTDGQNTLNMQIDRSALGSASGVARCAFAGAVDDRSAGGDRHVAITLGGTCVTSTDQPIIHSVVIEGVT